MLEIMRQSSENLTKKEIFLMTKNQNIKTMKSLDNGQKLTVKHWVQFTDVNGTGEKVEILSIMDESDMVVATNSQSFRDMFFDIVGIMGENELEGFTIEKIGGKSKAGRDFVTCALV